MASARTATVNRKVNTADPILPVWPAPQFDNAGSPEPASRRQRVLVAMAVALSALLVVSGVAAALVRLPYESIGPGSTRVVNDVVKVEGHESYPPEGEIIYATVSVRERVSALQALVGWLDPDTDVLPEKVVRGDIPRDKYRQLNVEAMNDSKTTAQVVALRQLGYTNLGAGAEVQAVSPGSPAEPILRAKDVIVGIDGKPVSDAGDVVNGIRAHQPGDVVTLHVTRDGGAPVEQQAVLTNADDGRPLLGVRVATKVRLPFEVTIDSGRVVGPSAGLSYALEVLDVLTPGELTGGVTVAATGELHPNGEVGPIGGVAQKVITVKRAGAKVFLVPKANEAEARSRAGKGLTVVPVASFEEALTALGSLQGSNAQALARPSPGT
jgi:PDZ domain-containing protein